MSRVQGRIVMRTDFRDKAAVISLAKRFGRGQTVFKHPERDNYNITHTERFKGKPDEYEGCEVVYQT